MAAQSHSMPSSIPSPVLALLALKIYAFDDTSYQRYSGI
jgi:hypothetical protein